MVLARPYLKHEFSMGERAFSVSLEHTLYSSYFHTAIIFAQPYLKHEFSMGNRAFSVGKLCTLHISTQLWFLPGPT